MYIERREKLNAIGFEWDDVLQANWEAMYEGLKLYNAHYKDCCVPYSYDGESPGLPCKLGHWVSNQRSIIPTKAEEGNDAALDRKRRLDEVGFVWDLSHTNWMKMYEKLQEYHSVHGNCRVPKSYDLDCTSLPAKLHNWVHVQKSSVPERAENGDPVYVERKALLDSLHFDYDMTRNVLGAKWEDMFERLKSYHSVEGNCRVPLGYDDGSDGPSLSVWCRSQRSVLGKATSGNPKYLERKRLLDTLSYEFEKVDETNWMTMFDLLKKFLEEHGHCNVPFSYGSGNDDDAPRALGHWCYEQRTNVPARLDKLNSSCDYKKRKTLLDSLGFEWVVESETEKKWTASFERLKRFKEGHGHCRVPPRVSNEDSESSLYSWVKNQQGKVLPRANRRDPVALERKRRLDSIGFEWTRIYDDNWEMMFKSLVDYKDEHGHCRVPYRGNGAVDGPTGQLGVWVYRQRTSVPTKASEGDDVYIERKERLDSIGFEWTAVHSSKWEVMFAGLNRFHKKYGHARVKRDYKDVDQPLPANLESWLSTQRMQIPESIERGDEVAVERKTRLDSLGFLWRTRAPPKQYTRKGKVVNGGQASAVTLANDGQSRQRGGLAEENPVNMPNSSSRRKAKSPGRNLAATVPSPPLDAPGPNGTLFAFPDYDACKEPVKRKGAFGYYKSKFRRDVKESLDPSERTKERVLDILHDRWEQLAADEKEPYRKWARWDKLRYERDVTLFGRHQTATRKRKSSPTPRAKLSKKQRDK